MRVSAISAMNNKTARSTGRSPGAGVLLILTSTSNTVARSVLRFKSGGPHGRTEFGMRLSDTPDVQVLPAKPQYSATP